MAQFALRFDFRSPEFATPPARLYPAAIEIAAWGERVGVSLIRIPEHHMAEDGYLPSPIAVAAAFSGVTKTPRMRFNAMLIPLYEPIKLAEDLAVLDNLSAGRIEIVVGAGYRTEEFEMFGYDYKERFHKMEEMIAIFQQAWTGEPFTYRGHQALVRPRPVQSPHPPIIMGGSSVGSAKRAARLDLAFQPSIDDIYDVYQQERAQLGLPPAPPLPARGPSFLFLSEDPERAWEKVMPHVLHEANSYAGWLANRRLSNYRPETAESVRANPNYAILTPTECVAMIEGLPQDAVVALHPLVGGLDPDYTWTSLELFEHKVLPALSKSK